MKIKVKLLRTKKTKEIDLKIGSTVEDVLKKINLKPDTVVVMNKLKPIPVNDEIINGDELTILQVSSGG